MDRVPLFEQQEYLISCLDHPLSVAVRSEANGATPIFAPGALAGGINDDVIGNAQGTCMKILSEDFLKIYPLHSWRRKFFSSKQPAGVRFSEHIADLRRAGDESDLANLTVDQMYCLVYMRSCTDDKLRKKLMEI